MDSPIQTLLFGLPKAQIARLQRVQNAAARLILGIGKFSHITPALYELHWLLPISLRIDYKILLLTFKCIYGLASTYLSDLISIKSNSLYNLRSTGKLLLDRKGEMLTTLGVRSFSAAAPKLWNGLPVQIRQETPLDSFKSRLKTYLFKKYFNSLPTLVILVSR